MVYPVKDKHIHHFRGKLDYKRHIESGMETYGPAKTRGRALIIGPCLLRPPCPGSSIFIHVNKENMFFYRAYGELNA